MAYETLYNIITNQGITRNKLATLTGIAPSDIYRAFNGAIPMHPGWKKRIASALDMPEDVLFPDGEDEYVAAFRKRLIRLKSFQTADREDMDQIFINPSQVLYFYGQVIDGVECTFLRMADGTGYYLSSAPLIVACTLDSDRIGL